MPLLGEYIWAEVNQTLLSTSLGHQMPLLGYIWLTWSHTLVKPLSLISLFNYRLRTTRRKDKSTYTQYFSVQFSRTHIQLLTVLWQNTQFNSSALQCMTYLSNGWTWNEQKNICTHNTLQLSTSLGHKMLLWGGTSELRSTGHNLVPFLATRCLYLGVHLISAQVHQTQCSTTFGH